MQQIARFVMIAFLPLALGCGGGGGPSVDGGADGGRDGSPPVDTGTDADAGGGDAGGGGCVAASGWTVERSPLNGKQGIAVDGAGVLHVVGIGPSGLEVYRRAADGTWMGPEESGLMPSWTVISAALPVAAGPGGEIVVEHEGTSDVIYRDAAGTWSMDSLGGTLGVLSEPIFDPDGTAHTIRDMAGTVQHLSRAPGAGWTPETIPGFPDTPQASMGHIEGALSACTVRRLALACSTRDAGGTWSDTVEEAGGLEARSVVSAGERWVLGSLMPVDPSFFSARTVIEPAGGRLWRTVAIDMSPGPDASAFFFVAHDPSTDTHIVHQVTDPDDASTAHVRYVHVAADGSVDAELVACDAFRPDIAVLPGERPVVLYEANDPTSGTLATFLAFGPG